ncbi:hypothetical protein A2T55_04040 [Brevibacterium linens]|uniref:Uncharacterized protein n=1 Tax=Brevibacterium linens TaxID=1703 RepID=A0A142NL38_BRELN|nr:hypothetical protein A2T55_04040 [Brevibacterium linens]
MDRWREKECFIAETSLQWYLFRWSRAIRGIDTSSFTKQYLQCPDMESYSHDTNEANTKQQPDDVQSLERSFHHILVKAFGRLSA